MFMSTTDNTVSVAAPATKILTAWAAVGLTSWTEIAAALAALYTFLLILEWLWKKLARPFCERHGWVRRLRRRSYDMKDE